MNSEETGNAEERIFRGALQVFAEKGKDGARMQEIADEAGINKAMLHYYYRSKDKLYEAVFRYVFKRFTKHEFQSIHAQPKSYKELLQSFIAGFIDAHKKEPAITKLFANENLSGGTTMCKIIEEKDELPHSSPPHIFIERTKEAISKGEIRPVDPHHLVLTIISSCLFVFIWAPTVKYRIKESAENWDGFIEARKQHIFDLIYNGLTVNAKPQTHE